jgi:DNA-binding MarR family transcriptional regulator
MKIEEEIQQKKFQNASQKAIINVIYTANWFYTNQNTFLKPFGITAQQFNILRILKGQYPKSISGKEIRSRMLDRNSDVSRLLDRLHLKGLITRNICPNDKRAADVSISQQGLDLLITIDKQSKSMEQTLYLSEEDATRLSDLLDKARG